MINHFINHHDEDYPKEKSLFNFVVSLIWMDSPHLALLSISEVYGIDFFEIYSSSNEKYALFLHRETDRTYLYAAGCGRYHAECQRDTCVSS